MFSKVSFDAGHDSLAILGISGTGSAALLQKLAYPQPAAVGQLSSVAGGKLLRLADEHYLLVLDFSHARQLLAEQSAYLAAPTLWLAQHIQQGFSYLEQAVIGEYVPQMLNLQSINAISFTKGCYIGQELSLIHI